MTVHTLKTWPPFFEAIKTRRKTHEVRKNDRGFATGDVLQLCEYDPDDGTGKYTAREIFVLVTHMTTGPAFGLPVDLCVMSIAILEVTP